MLQLAEAVVADFLSRVNLRAPLLKTPQILTDLAGKDDPAGVQLEHFLAWVRASRGVPVGEAYPGIAVDLMFELLRPEFEFHLAGSTCVMEWFQVFDAGFTGWPEYRGRFVCRA